jgi:hypothetical protein
MSSEVPTGFEDSKVDVGEPDSQVEREAPVPREECDFDVYMIHSYSTTLGEIRDFLLTKAKEPEHIGHLHLEYDRTHDKNNKTRYTVSNRVVGLLHKSLYTRLVNDGYDVAGVEGNFEDFRITEYNIAKYMFVGDPNTPALYVSLPVDFRTFSECKDDLSRKLDIIVKCGIIRRNAFSVSYPVIDRNFEGKDDGSNNKNYAIVSFFGKRDDRNNMNCYRRMISILDHNAHRKPDNEIYVCRTFWHNKPGFNRFRQRRHQRGNRSKEEVDETPTNYKTSTQFTRNRHYSHRFPREEEE